MDQLDDMATGAAVLGTGGGGDPYIGKLLAREALRDRPPLTMLSFDELDDDDFVILGGAGGAPTVGVEKLPSGHELVHAFRTLETHFGKKFTAVMSPEAGGINSMIPISLAAAVGLPLVDGDIMGRAFPEIQMAIPTLWGITATPMAMADEKGNAIILDTISNRWTEVMARSLIVQMGAVTHATNFPMTGAQVKQAAISGTMTLIGQIGRAIREAREQHRDPIAAATAITGGHELWRGKIADVDRRTVGGFARGAARIVGTGAYADHTLQLDFQNEFLAARVGDEMLATTPDLITVLDAETGEPITTENLRYGFRVAVLGIPCDPRWRSEGGIALAGPRYFGYDVPYIPVEERLAASPLTR